MHEISLNKSREGRTKQASKQERKKKRFSSKDITYFDRIQKGIIKN
jgi:hypothetical protein